MTELKKDFRLYGLTMVAIGSCIGSEIFLTPSQIVGYLPSPLWILLVWALGGVITLTGALTFAELGSMFPQAGGVYVYLKEAYGELFGFLYGWAYLLVITSGANAALSIACAYYLAFIFPLNQTGIKITAVVALIVVTAVNIFRVRAGRSFPYRHCFFPRKPGGCLWPGPYRRSLVLWRLATCHFCRRRSS
jgi:APA family basic amino acid/polyamine antiporter